MISPWNVLSFLFQAVVLLFTSLALGVAFSRARVHLPWLVPLVIGQALALFGNVPSFFMMSYMVNQHVPFSQMSWLLIPQQIVLGLSMLAHIWFAVALFLTLKANAFPSRQTTQQHVPGSWPPPPSV